MRAILDGQPMKYVYPLVIVGGMVEAFANLAVQFPLNLMLPAIWFRNLDFKTACVLTFGGIILILGPLVGLIRLWLGSYLLAWTGHWVGGKGNKTHIMSAIGWVEVIWIPSMLVIGLSVLPPIFMAILTEVDETFLQYLIIGGVLLGVIGILWGFVAFLKCLAEAQGFSTGQALLNVIFSALIAAAILIIPMLFFAIVIPMFFR